ncbi:MAG TPA: DUF3343 domain-containing protein [Clostridiaceae bacterium]|nr:DUF3343 domain-containing protein [Clostridiaceae bacterium]
MIFIITFATVTDALAVEAYAAATGLGGEIIALPGYLKAGCGFAYEIDATNKEELATCLAEARLPYETIEEAMTDSF